MNIQILLLVGQSFYVIRWLSKVAGHHLPIKHQWAGRPPQINDCAMPGLAYLTLPLSHSRSPSLIRMCTRTHRRILALVDMVYETLNSNQWCKVCVDSPLKML